jgi:hypothetical protein
MQNGNVCAGVIDVPFLAGDFTASGGMTWTVTSAEVDVFRIVLFSTTPGLALIIFRCHGTTTGGIADANLFVQLPLGFTSSIVAHAFCHLDYGAGPETGEAEASAGSRKILIGRLVGGNIGLNPAVIVGFELFITITQ